MLEVQIVDLRINILKEMQIYSRGCVSYLAMTPAHCISVQQFKPILFCKADPVSAFNGEINMKIAGFVDNQFCQMCRLLQIDDL